MERSDEDLVISGLSVRLPESDNVEEFWTNLVNGVDMVTEDARRWPPGYHGLPPRNGKLKDLSKFDCGFFGVTPKQAERMDPQLRILLEVSYEAIVESGHSLHSMKGSTTGVFIGSTLSDAHELNTSSCDVITGYEMTGCNRTMLANRLSYVYDLKGPSLTVDTACSSGLESLCLASSAIRQGRCDRAIVGGVNLLLKPETSMQFLKLNMLSPDGACKTFDQSADGYCRSEGVVAIILEPRRSSRRQLLTIRSIVDSSDGYKPQGITYPSLGAQKDLLQKAYSAAKIDMDDLVYLEAHGTGTQAGDSTELTAIDEVLCQNRTQCLLVGSVKSNIGHTEATSGLVSIAKIILAEHHHTLPGNLHFSNPNTKIPALCNGHLKVVSKNTPWQGGIVGINSFGFGGANVHAVVETCGIKRSKDLSPRAVTSNNALSQLVIAASRTEGSVRRMLTDIQESLESGTDVRGILAEMSQESLVTHPARGFALTACDISEIKEHKSSPRSPLWFVYPGMGCQWPGMGRELLQVPHFAAVIRKCHNALMSEDFDLLTLLEQGDAEAYADPLNSFVGICAIQLALTEVLLGVGLVPDGILGHSVGELGCAFADNSLTVEQTILAAYWRGRCVKEANLPPGAMAAVGVTWEEALKQCPGDVVPACHNAGNMVTVSGPQQQVDQFVEKLQGDSVFARIVNSSGIAFHSPYMKRCSGALLEKLKQVIPDPRPRSDRWVSTSVPAEKAGDSHSQLSSAEYHVNNLLSPVLFKEGLTQIPDNAVVIEIGPHNLLLALIKRELGSSITALGTMQRNSDRNIPFLLSNIGRCYLEGHNIVLTSLYGACHYPVPPDTPLISACLSWQHAEDWRVPSYTDTVAGTASKAVKVDLADPEDMYLADHSIDGRILFPAAGFACMAWKACAKEHDMEYEAMDVIIENLKVHEALILGKDAVTFSSQYSRSTGRLEICIKSLLVCSATVQPMSKAVKPRVAMATYSADKAHDILLNKEDIYKYFRIKGYDYGDTFQCIKDYNLSSHWGELEGCSNWITHIDALLHVCLLEDQQDRDLVLPTTLKHMLITPSSSSTAHKAYAGSSIHYKACTGEVLSDTVTIKDVHFASSTRRSDTIRPVHCKYSFETFTGETPPCPKNLSTIQLTRAVRNIGTLYIHMYNSKNHPSYVRESSGMYANYLKQLQPVEEKPATVDELNDEALLKICIDICAENIRSGNIVMGCSVQTPTGLKFIRIISSLIKFFAHVSISIWVFSTEPGLLDDVNLPHLEVYPSLAAVSKNILESTNILTFDTAESNGIFSKILPQFVFFLSTKPGVKVDIPTGYIATVQKSSNLSEITVVQKQNPEVTNTHIVQMKSGSYDWVEKVQQIMSGVKNPKTERVWLVHTGEEPSGIVGLVNCLIHEPGGEMIRCLFNSSLDKHPIPAKFMPGKEEFDVMTSKSLTMNIFRNGQLGSFRRKLLTEDSLVRHVSDAFLDIGVKGDMTSIGWFEANPEDLEMSPDCDIVHVTHAALNFRDVMCASGRLSADALPGMSGTLLGLEFAGYDQNGIRRMGIRNGKGFSTRVRVLKNHTWVVPSAWTLEDAATIPVAYVTAYYSLLVRAQISTGKRLLVHSACSAVGQAAIHIAKSIGCVIYATAGTPAKRDFLVQKCGIPLDRVANSRDLSFYDQFMNVTNGEGMDFILNALAEDKLKASLDLLHDNGHFLEIGKFDLAQNNNLGMSIFLKNISFHGVQIETILQPDNQNWIKVHRLVQEGISNDVVKPLNVSLFSRDNILSAFRYMGEGSHIGKIVVQIRSPEDIQRLQTRMYVGLEKIQAQRTIYFKSNVSYIITGRLGGLALEMVNWMVRKGARHVVLTSRSGVKTGYQKWLLAMWRRKGVNVVVSKHDVSDYHQTESLFKLAFSLAPVGGIFHLAAVLHDAMFQTQTPETFHEVTKVKVAGVDHLDRVSRLMCGRALDHFVAFSSAAASYGNAGQSNYGYANSYMERVCEQRVADGLSGKALQWGFIGDVGIVQEHLGGNSLYHMGMVPQRIPSFLASLQLFLLSDGVVYSSIQPAPRHTEQRDSISREDFTSQVAGAVMDIIGVRDGSHISSTTPLIEMGLDSLMTTEIRQVLGRRFDLNLSVAEVQNLTLDQVKTLKH